MNSMKKKSVTNKNKPKKSSLSSTEKDINTRLAKA